MSAKTVIDAAYTRGGPGPLRYRPVLAWCVQRGCTLGEGAGLAHPFQSDPGGGAECRVHSPRGGAWSPKELAAGIREQFTLPDGVVVTDEGLRDPIERTRVLFMGPPPPTDAEVLAAHGEASLGDVAADAALANFLRFRDSVDADIRDTDMRYSEAVSDRIYAVLAGSDTAVALDAALQRLGATPASRLGTLTHFSVRQGDEYPEKGA